MKRMLLFGLFALVFPAAVLGMAIAESPYDPASELLPPWNGLLIVTNGYASGETAADIYGTAVVKEYRYTAEGTIGEKRVENRLSG